jgi:hypothetical protein
VAGCGNGRDTACTLLEQLLPRNGPGPAGELSAPQRRGALRQSTQGMDQDGHPHRKTGGPLPGDGAHHSARDLTEPAIWQPFPKRTYLQTPPEFCVPCGQHLPPELDVPLGQHRPPSLRVPFGQHLPPEFDVPLGQHRPPSSRVPFGHPSSGPAFSFSRALSIGSVAALSSVDASCGTTSSTRLSRLFDMPLLIASIGGTTLSSGMLSPLSSPVPSVRP